MIKRLKQTTIMFLMLFIQLQPVHVHAVMLDADQGGHVAGTLSHSHAQEPHDQEQLDSSSDSDKHLSECHPVHTLSPPLSYAQSTNLSYQTTTEQLTTGLISIHIALDPPPPKHT
jgi:hypothetical protein